jgi:hypothetical protein
VVYKVTTGFSKVNEIVNGALRDMHRLYHGVLHFPNIKRFHGLRVRVNVNWRSNFHGTYKRSTALCSYLLYRTSPIPDNERGKHGHKFIYPLRPLSRNSWSLSNILWTFSIPILCKSEEKYRHYEQHFIDTYGLNYINFHETDKCSTTLRRHLLH